MSPTSIQIFLYRQPLTQMIPLQDPYADLLRPSSWNWADDNEEECPLPSPIEFTQDSGEGEERMPSTADSENAYEVHTGARSDPTIQDTIDNVYVWRSYRVEYDSTIHHFNWLGQPVWQRSTTAPADSLVFIQGKPKTAWSLGDYRVQSILNRAMHFVDPVVAILDDRDASLLNLKGTALAQAAIGRVYRLYSPHGQWMTDEAEETEETILDHGDSRFHTSSTLAIGSGYIVHGSIRTPSAWFKDAALNAEASHPRKLHWKPMPSRLGLSFGEDARPKLHDLPYRPSVRLPAATSTAVQDNSADRLPSVPVDESSRVLANSHKEGTSFDLDDDVPARPVVRLPPTIPNAALDDLPNRTSSILVDGISDAVAHARSNRVSGDPSEGDFDSLPDALLTDLNEDPSLARAGLELESISEFLFDEHSDYGSDAISDTEIFDNNAGIRSDGRSDSTVS